MFMPNECPFRVFDPDPISPCTVNQVCGHNANQALMKDSFVYCTQYAKWTPELACEGKELTLQCGFIMNGRVIEVEDHMHVLGI